jgi:hypothetical protein
MAFSWESCALLAVGDDYLFNAVRVVAASRPRCSMNRDGRARAPPPGIEQRHFSDVVQGTWERHEEVAQRAELVVVDRPGPGPMPDPEYRWIRVDIPELEISSTELRARVKARRSIDYLTPPAVVTYISRRGLYR